MDVSRSSLGETGLMRDAMFNDPCTLKKAQQCCLTKFHHINFERFLKNVTILIVISVDLTLARARSIGP